jgi:hypothetical protein
VTRNRTEAPPLAPRAARRASAAAAAIKASSLRDRSHGGPKRPLPRGTETKRPLERSYGGPKRPPTGDRNNRSHGGSKRLPLMARSYAYQ